MSVDRYSLGVAFVLLAGACLRVWSLGFGLPDVESRPDEWMIISKALGYGTGDLNPHFFNYPSLFSYILFLLYGSYAVILCFAGSLSSLSGVAQDVAADPSVYILIARLLSALSSTATIYLIIRLMIRESVAKPASLLAGACLAMCYLHLREAHFGVTDSMMTMMVVAAMQPLTGVFRRGTWRDYMLTGCLAGLATSIKYNAGILALSIFLAHWLSFRLRPMAPIRRLVDRRLWACAGIMLLFFFLGSPFIVFDFGTFLRDFVFEVQHLAGVGEFHVGRGWWYHAMVTLRYGCGPGVLVMALAGALFLLRRDWHLGVVWLSFPLCYYVLLGRGYTVFVRYMLPVTPFVALLAGVGCLQAARIISEAMARRWKCVGTPVIASLITALITIEPLVRSVLFLDRLGQSDTREEMMNYLATNLPGDISIGWLGTRYGIPRFSEGAQSIQDRLQEHKQHRQGRLVAARIEHAVRMRFQMRVIHINSRDSLALDGRLDYIISEHYPIAWSMQVSEGAEAALMAAGFVEVMRVSPYAEYNEKQCRPIFDVQDSFYLPYAGFANIRRPGPELVLWAKEAVSQ